MMPVANAAASRVVFASHRPPARPRRAACCVTPPCSTSAAIRSASSSACNASWRGRATGRPARLGAGAPRARVARGVSKTTGRAGARPGRLVRVPPRLHRRGGPERRRLPRARRDAVRARAPAGRAPPRRRRRPGAAGATARGSSGSAISICPTTPSATPAPSSWPAVPYLDGLASLNLASTALGNTGLRRPWPTRRTCAACASCICATTASAPAAFAPWPSRRSPASSASLHLGFNDLGREPPSCGARSASACRFDLIRRLRLSVRTECRRRER